MARNQDFHFPRDDQEQGASRLQKLHSHWDRATTLVMKNRIVCDAWFYEKIVAMYSEPGRFYHTLVHLEEMLGFLEIFQDNSVLDNSTLVLTIFFHDVIYDPKSATNEEDSAELFQEFLRQAHCDNDELISRVPSYILATKQHKSTESDSCAQLLLDMDMAVLGKEKEAYWAYAALIRREFNFVEHSVYCVKRAEVLKGLLKCPQIYGTKSISDALEERARENLKAEIESLKMGRIPEV